jgi:hypothetical protein
LAMERPALHRVQPLQRVPAVPALCACAVAGVVATVSMMHALTMR